MTVEPQQRFVKSQRVQISYWDWGNEGAPPLVLVHGGRDHARSWGHLAEELRADYHVVAPDLRGHGDSGWTPGGSYGLPEWLRVSIGLPAENEKFLMALRQALGKA